ncbi:YaaR family protein [Tumebacillus lipolyticus]|uniref:YaaR family protein n=1 Tax=Tumebacillus lipolyticus TaxID=1280370 RepID=A0ABW4ZZG0_9BACL
MKIGNNQRPFVETLGLREDARAGDVKSPAFQDVFQQANARLTRAELDKLMRQIDNLGNHLAKNMTWKALQDYKEQVRRFLEQVVKGGFGAKEKQGFDRRGRMRLYKIVSQLDDLMAELAEQVVRDEQDHLDLLAKIGDIRGLLLNLYF